MSPGLRAGLGLAGAVVFIYAVGFGAYLVVRRPAEDFGSRDAVEAGLRAIVEQGDTALARSWFVRALGYTDNFDAEANAAAYFNLGLLSSAHGAYELARAHYTSAAATTTNEQWRVRAISEWERLSDAEEGQGPGASREAAWAQRLSDALTALRENRWANADALLMRSWIAAPEAIRTEIEAVIATLEADPTIAAAIAPSRRTLATGTLRSLRAQHSLDNLPRLVVEGEYARVIRNVDGLLEEVASFPPPLRRHPIIRDAVRAAENVRGQARREAQAAERRAIAALLAEHAEILSVVRWDRDGGRYRAALARIDSLLPHVRAAVSRHSASTSLHSHARATRALRDSIKSACRAEADVLGTSMAAC